MNSFCRAIMVAGLLCAAGRLATAGTVSYSFNGTITFVNSFLGTDLAAGNSLSGTVTYDTATIDSTAAADIGSYVGALTEFSLTFNGTAGPFNVTLDALSAGDIFVIEDSGNDIFQVSVHSSDIDGDPLNSFNLSSASMVELGPVSMFSSDALPTSADFLDDILFGTRKVEWLKPGFGALPVLFTISSYAPIPEPSALALGALGAGILMMWRRLRR